MSNTRHVRARHVQSSTTESRLPVRQSAPRSLKQPKMQTHRRSLFLMAIVLLVATALRAQDLSLMQDMLHYDEAYYGVDALSLLAQPRLTVFFPDNFGREGLWMVLLTPALAAFGANSFALRSTALFAGVLTVAAVFRLGRVLFGWRAGVWSAAALAVLFWHVLASHQAFRALLYPLVGALAFAALWKPLTVGARPRFAAAAVWLGILAYTYIAARAWVALGGVMVALALAARVRAWRAGEEASEDRSPPPRTRQAVGQALRAILLFLVIIAPLAWTLLTNPALANLRGEQVAIRSVDALIDNMMAWASALVARGSGDIAYNLPGRPILDLPLLLLLVLGALVWGWRQRFRTSHPAVRTGMVGFIPTTFVLALLGASLAPALLTTDTLKPLRAIGAVVPLTLLIGAAVAGMTSNGALRRLREERGRREWRPEGLVGKFRTGGARLAHIFGTALPPLLLTLAAINTTHDLAAWVRSPDLFLPMEQHLMRGIDRLTGSGDTTPVYFSPFTPDHPVIRFRSGDVSPRPVSAFRTQECVRLAAGGADYLALTLFDPGFADQLRPYAEVHEVWREALEPPRYILYHAQADAAWLGEPQVVWAGALGITRIDGVPDVAVPGSAYALTLAMRLTDAEDAARSNPALPTDDSGVLPPLTLFAHLYGDPTPYEGGVLWAQADLPLCPGSPPATWRVDEVIVQGTTLVLPPDLPAGRYLLALGMYDSRTGMRLPVTTPNEGLDYARVASVIVE